MRHDPFSTSYSRLENKRRESKNTIHGSKSGGEGFGKTRWETWQVLISTRKMIEKVAKEDGRT